MTQFKWPATVNGTMKVPYANLTAKEGYWEAEILAKILKHIFHEADMIANNSQSPFNVIRKGQSLIGYTDANR